MSSLRDWRHRHDRFFQRAKAEEYAARFERALDLALALPVPGAHFVGHRAPSS
jgi:hypothetical protein